MTTQQTQMWYEKVASNVKLTSERIENDYLLPLLHQSRTLLFQRPISSTFLLVFGLLSAVPLGCFLPFTLFVLGGYVLSVILAAITCVCIGLFIYVLIAGPILSLLLIVVLISSIFLTSAIVGGYFAQRLGFHVRRHTSFRDGYALWLEEIKVTLLGAPDKRYNAEHDLANVKVEEDVKPVIETETRPPLTPENKIDEF